MAKEKIEKPLKMLEVQISGTTDSNGCLITQYNRSDYAVVYAMSGGTVIVPYGQTAGDGGKIALKFFFVANFAPVTSRAMSATMWLLPTH